MASTFDSLLTAVRDRVDALGLVFGASNQSVAVEKRKLPKHGQQVDGPLPRLVVCPSERQGPDEPWSTEGAGGDGGPQRLREYRVQVAMIAAGNKDAISHLGDYLDWRQQVARSFGFVYSLDRVPGLYRVDVVPDTLLDRSAYSALYDYQALELRCSVVEQAV